MRAFEYSITDDRAAAPELRWLVVGDVERAKEFAWRDLRQEAHYQVAELRENGALVFRVTRADLPPGLAAAPAERRTFRGFRGFRPDR